MSKAAREWFKRQKIEDKSLTAILQALAASTEDGVCRITQKKLTSKSGLGERTVRAGISTLEVLGVVHRTKQPGWGKRGRAVDVICLALDLDFDIDREAVLAAKSGKGISGKPAGVPHGELSGNFAGAPTLGRCVQDHASSTRQESQHVGSECPAWSNRSGDHGRHRAIQAIGMGKTRARHRCHLPLA
ncbi:hypothetical protein NA8A_13634 [Nitratireductor indicus C115]|uniref:Helix-turn-helix domain-containing protein n=1 Tax=Nitratireductor indicus C115 TaxID=1231190 RepID=K2PKP2_9HYPH|nr:hypothetical protein [Nitratireductor indicus]EKF41662.1 hypothetical protein NA8A_13634 [Nitratireductor indicus C115]